MLRGIRWCALTCTGYYCLRRIRTWHLSIYLDAVDAFSLGGQQVLWS